MSSTTAKRLPSLDEAAAFSPQQVVELVGSLSREVETLKHQLDWFKRQVFGQKSERRIIDSNDGQMSLGELLHPKQTASAPPPKDRPVAGHTRRQATKVPDSNDGRGQVICSWPSGSTANPRFCAPTTNRCSSPACSARCSV